jgi:hypothetical protein
MIDGLKNSGSLAQSLDINDYMIVSNDQGIIISRSLADKLEMMSDLPVRIVD